ncbi:MAG: NTP transferase domain-containing protein [Armatimonadetes bacterium]|nr:NTP transferase domain-containing protein [Armatimonadota bacterium]
MKLHTAIVPAAGRGTRMRPLTSAVPKELLPLGRKAGLQHIAHELAAAGIQKIVLITSPEKEAILRGAFGDRDPDTGTLFVYAVQQTMRGLGDAVRCAAPFVLIGEPVIIALGDAVIGEPEPGGLTRRLIDACASDPRTVGLCVQAVPPEQVSRYGVVKPATEATDAPFAITDIIEKPTPELAPSRFAASGRYLLPYAAFDVLMQTAPDAKGEIQLTDALRELLLTHPGVAVPLLTGETRHDIGGWDSYYRAFLTFALSDPDAANLRRDFLQNPTVNKEPAA